MRSLLIVVEFALSAVLLTGAGLLAHSFLVVKAVDPGFAPEHVLKVSVAAPSGSSSERADSMDAAILNRLHGVPGVTAVGAVDGLFELGATNNLGLRSIEGRAPEPRDQWTALTWATVRGEYFQALGGRLLHGRYFSDADGAASPLVAVIDESAARRYWRGEDPVGRRFKGQDRRGANDDWITVIGVVADIRTHGLERAATPHVYEWYRQGTDATADIVIRTTGDAQEMAATVREAIRSVAPASVVSKVTTVEQELSRQLAPRRFQTSLLGLFSLLALVLASVGIYGSMHYSIVQRTPEIGIRMALGAQRLTILTGILREGLQLAVTGLGVGLALDWMATRVLARLLYGVRPSDPSTLLGVGLLLIGVGLMATLIPARRAASIDPMQALRME